MAPDNHAAPFQYLFMSGTSFSAPTVSGVVALMLQRNPALTNADATFGTIDNPASWAPGRLERLPEASATVVPPGSVQVVHRVGDVITGCWEGANGLLQRARRSRRQLDLRRRRRGGGWLVPAGSAASGD